MAEVNIFSSFIILIRIFLSFFKQHRSGKFKNIAYVEYAEENATKKAILGTNQTEIRGHMLNVSISAPPPKPSAGSSSNANVTKLVSFNSKRNKSTTEQKPRMSLIPSVVRKQFATAPSAPTASNGTVATPKSNADFRKLLEK